MMYSCASTGCVSVHVQGVLVYTYMMYSCTSTGCVSVHLQGVLVGVQGVLVYVHVHDVFMCKYRVC